MFEKTEVLLRVSALLTVQSQPQRDSLLQSPVSPLPSPQQGHSLASFFQQVPEEWSEGPAQELLRVGDQGLLHLPLASQHHHGHWAHPHGEDIAMDPGPLWRDRVPGLWRKISGLHFRIFLLARISCLFAPNTHFSCTFSEHPPLRLYKPNPEFLCQHHYHSWGHGLPVPCK